MTAAVLLALTALEARAQVKAGPEFGVNTYTTGIQDQCAVAVEPDGDFVVVWESTGQDGFADGVFGQRYDRSGTRRGGEFRANSTVLENQQNADVAAGRKSFVVVWESNLQDGAGDGIFGQLFDASGNGVGTEFQVNAYTTGSQFLPAVAMDGIGGFMVVWDSAGQDGSLGGVFGQRYSASGNAIGGEFQVSTYTTGAQDTAKVAVHPDGRAVVIWESTGQDGDGDGVFGQRYDASGNPAGAEFQVNTNTTSTQGDPVVGIAGDGRFVVVWEDSSVIANGQDVRARLYEPSGNAVGADFVVNSYTTATQWVYGVGVDAQGNFQVAWESTGNRDGSANSIWAQRFTSAGALRGAEFLVNTFTTGSQGWPVLASDEVGNAVVAWQSFQDPAPASFGVYAQRVGGLYPASLAVDTTGNNVLEPGETVNVAPAWRNHVGSAQTFTGTLTGISGPAGATYAITDATADHGTVPDNGTSACGADCYGVSVSNPSPRPVQHWDASALESILPDAQGQRKRWTLHIGASFGDVPTSNAFYRFVETLLHHSVTGGCSPTGYCPANATTRDQMAVFVLVAREGAGYGPAACGAIPMFADVPPSSPFCRWIEELARRGVVGGCGAGNYCPSAQVTREQMAVFVLRTLDPALSPPACAPPNIYNDVPETSGFCRWIEELTNRGVVSGCGGGNYCPTGAVTREQMGVFLSVTFGLSLYGL